MESASGVVMLIATALALMAANSALHLHYYDMIRFPITLLGITEPLKLWVKDILMVFFFLLVGLELKREFMEGCLAKRDQVVLPFFAAAAGMGLPALIYLGITGSDATLIAGWAIPSATDIAFALCVLMLAAPNIPPAAKIFLLAIAIFDDLGAILIIAFFYSATPSAAALGFVALGVAVLYGLQRASITPLWPYLLVGVGLWFALHAAGIHTTVAGVLVGLMVPMRCGRNHNDSPVNRAIHFLHPWVGFLVLPIFAFTSAGVNFSGLTLQNLLQPLPLGIAAALFFGKQMGIFGITFLAIKTRIVSMPSGASWAQLYGVSVLAGIGFTMSLFVGALAFPEAMQNEVTLGVLFGSLLSTIWGAGILRFGGNHVRT